MYFKENLLFVHIPKCGGNTIMDFFHDRSGDKNKIHWTVKQYKRENKKKFLQCFVFTFVRNIFQQVVSMYEYSKFVHDFIKEISFQEFLFSDNSILQRLRHAVKQKNYIYDNNINCVSYIGDINNASLHLENICNHLKIDFNNTIPHSNKNSKADYRTYLNDNIIDKIKSEFATDIDYFGYDPYNLDKIKNIGFVKKDQCKFV
jgi:hypothetical protein